MTIQRKPVVVPANAPYLPAFITQEVAYAVRAFSAGEADKGQQALACRWLVWELCKTYDMSYRPDIKCDQDFAEGKRYCGNELIRVIKLTDGDIAALPKMRAAGPGEDDDEMKNM